MTFRPPHPDYVSSVVVDGINLCSEFCPPLLHFYRLFDKFSQFCHVLSCQLNAYPSKLGLVAPGRNWRIFCKICRASKANKSPYLAFLRMGGYPCLWSPKKAFSCPGMEGRLCRVFSSTIFRPFRQVNCRNGELDENFGLVRLKFEGVRLKFDL